MNLLRTRKSLRGRNVYNITFKRRMKCILCWNSSLPKYAVVCFYCPISLGLSVCASSRSQTQACWSKEQVCGWRCSDMLAVAGPVGCEPLFCQQLILRGHDFGFRKRSYRGRSSNICSSMKNNRERWMQLRALHNTDESRVLFSF